MEDWYDLDLPECITTWKRLNSKYQSVFSPELKKTEKLVHWKGDPLELCQKCSRRNSCNESCLVEGNDIPEPRHYEMVLDERQIKTYLYLQKQLDILWEEGKYIH